MNENEKRLNIEKDWLTSVVSNATNINNYQYSHLRQEELDKVIKVKANFKESFFNKTSTNDKPTAFWAYRTRFYNSRHSEGNRFITNEDL